MRTLTLVFAILVSCSSRDQSQQNSSDDEHSGEEIDSSFEKYLKAMNSNDVDGLVKITSEDVTLMPPNREAVTGHSGIRKWFNQTTQNIRTTDLEMADRNLHVTKDWGIETGSYIWTLESVEGNRTINDKGKYITIWHKESNDWLIHSHIWNSDLQSLQLNQ